MKSKLIETPELMIKLGDDIRKKLVDDNVFAKNEQLLVTLNCLLWSNY
jgi:hypothetical protein